MGTRHDATNSTAVKHTLTTRRCLSLSTGGRLVDCVGSGCKMCNYRSLIKDRSAKIAAQQHRVRRSYDDVH